MQYASNPPRRHAGVALPAARFDPGLPGGQGDTLEHDEDSPTNQATVPGVCIVGPTTSEAGGCGGVREPGEEGGEAYEPYERVGELARLLGGARLQTQGSPIAELLIHLNIVIVDYYAIFMGTSSGMVEKVMVKWEMMLHTYRVQDSSPHSGRGRLVEEGKAGREAGREWL